MIMVCQPQSKSVGLVFQMTAERHRHRQARNGNNLDQENSQGQRGKIRQGVECEPEQDRLHGSRFDMPEWPASQ
jgi:hypothetical protein